MPLKGPQSLLSSRNRNSSLFDAEEPPPSPPPSRVVSPRGVTWMAASVMRGKLIYILLPASSQSRPAAATTV
ncbi:hypothetical protein BaRGS_00036070 [Batillaria attramentaria]|uniref:Uncharacterized protein n=1 Tax=Batillaria attramentaria TaxID=370345 RepID=A0ABD0JCZ1_9CAEN